MQTNGLGGGLDTSPFDFKDTDSPGSSPPSLRPPSGRSSCSSSSSMMGHTVAAIRAEDKIQDLQAERDALFERTLCLQSENEILKKEKRDLSASIAQINHRHTTEINNLRAQQESRINSAIRIAEGTNDYHMWDMGLKITTLVVILGVAAASITLTVVLV